MVLLAFGQLRETQMLSIVFVYTVRKEKLHMPYFVFYHYLP